MATISRSTIIGVYVAVAIASVVACVALSGCGGASPTGAAGVASSAAADKDKLQGTWVFDGNAVDESTVQKVIFAGSAATFYSSENNRQFNARQFRVRIEQATVPKSIDFVFTDGDDKGRPMEAIYRLDGDELEIALPFYLPGIGGSRPKGFSGSTMLLKRNR